MLVLLVVQTSTELRMMEHYATPLLSICKADENNAKLQGESNFDCESIQSGPTYLYKLPRDLAQALI